MSERPTMHPFIHAFVHPHRVLCGKVGETGDVFLIGYNVQVPGGLSGNLFLCINDDLTGEYGAGFSDNEGSVTVSIDVKPKKSK